MGVRGARGSNQYVTRPGGAVVPRPDPADLVAAVTTNPDPDNTPPDRPAGAAWAARNRGWIDPTLPGYEFPHRGSSAWVGDDPRLVTSEDRDAGRVWVAPGATRSDGGGDRKVFEPPDPFRSCFERDRDRVLHSTSFRRLAGKTQVHVAPENDMIRTRLTHALEVSQVAVAIASSCGLNVALTDAIAKAHDCGHTPCGHAGEDAFDVYFDDGFDHARWGADVALDELNLCAETLDGVRNHSWSHPAPVTPEATVVAFADRIAYLSHDLDDAYRAGILGPGDVPDPVAEVVGRQQREMIGRFVSGVLRGVKDTGRVCLPVEHAATLAALREFNHERIYDRREAAEQANRSIRMLRSLVDYHTEHPEMIPGYSTSQRDGGVPPQHAAVRWLAGATDRYAIRLASERLGWDHRRLPAGVI